MAYDIVVIVAGVATKRLTVWSQPSTRADCENGPRPCEWTSCRYNLEPDHDRARRIRLSGLGRTRTRDLAHQGKDAPPRFHDYGQSCALDLADDGPRTLDEVGEVLGVSREAVRLIEERAMKKLRQRVG